MTPSENISKKSIATGLLLFGILIAIWTSGSIYFTGTTANFILSRLILWLLLGLIFIYCLRFEHQPLLLWTEKPHSFLHMCVSILIILILVIVYSISIKIIAHAFHWQTNSAAVSRIVAYSAAIKLFTVVTAAYTEEMLFRGYLLPRLQLFFKNTWLPVMISAIIFGLAHFRYATFINIAGPMFIGFVFAAYYQKYRNIKVLIACHFIIDFIALFLF